MVRATSSMTVLMTCHGSGCSTNRASPEWRAPPWHTHNTPNTLHKEHLTVRGGHRRRHMTVIWRSYDGHMMVIWRSYDGHAKNDGRRMTEDRHVISDVVNDMSCMTCHKWRHKWRHAGRHVIWCTNWWIKFKKHTVALRMSMCDNGSIHVNVYVNSDINVYIDTLMYTLIH